MDGVPKKSLIAYCIVDEQSNTTLVDQKLVSFFCKEFPEQKYSVKFASQDCELRTCGSKVSGFNVRGIFQDEIIPIPDALSCSNIADTSNEVATPSIVRSHKHTAQYARFFPDYEPKAEMMILIGRNCGRLWRLNV